MLPEVPEHSGCILPLSYACLYLIKMWGIISLNFDNVQKQALIL